MATTPAASDPIVVFWTRRDSECDLCGAQLGRRSFIRVRDRSAACLECADLDHLVYLPRGDAALTRRAAKHSGLSAVVVQWSRARKRYERQGILVEEPALERAEEECLADAERREARRHRDVARRETWDGRFIESFAAAIGARHPGCPPDEALAIARRACERYSGRVGRSEGGRSLADGAVDLAVRAHVRHRHTGYDALLMAGRDRDEARASVASAVDAAMERWSRKLSEPGCRSSERSALPARPKADRSDARSAG
jgi:hypothetical protein